MSPIPFTNTPEEDVVGSVGYLKFLHPPANDWLGALFLIDAMGSPVEFTYARMRPPYSFMWRADDLRVHCQMVLCSAVFGTCPSAPLVILCEAEEVAPTLFLEHISVDIPVGLVSATKSAGEGETIVGGSVSWVTAPEAASSSESFFVAISGHGLLTEPFSRAEAGLREVYPDLFTS